jgi:hypothetical protein
MIIMELASASWIMEECQHKQAGLDKCGREEPAEL